MSSFRGFGNQSGSRVLSSLDFFQKSLWQINKQGIAIINTRDNQSVNKCFSCFYIQKLSDFRDVPDVKIC